MTRRLIASFLSVVMCLSLMCTAFAADTEATYGEYDPETGSVTVISTDSALEPETEYEMVVIVSPSGAAHMIAPNENIVTDKDGHLRLEISNVGEITDLTGWTVAIFGKSGGAVTSGPLKGSGAAPTVPVESVAVSPAVAEIEVGAATTLTAIITPEDASVKSTSWAVTSGSDCASVSQDGVVTGNAVGKAVVTVTVEDEDGNVKTAESTITVKDADAPAVSVTGVALNRSSLSMTVGDSAALIATVAPDDASDKRVTWTSSNPNTVRVSDTGVLTAASAGEAVITVKTVDGGFEASCTVTVRWGGYPTGPSYPSGGSSGTTTSSYKITVPSRVTGGTVKVSSTNAKKGTTVTITAIPEEGYELSSLTVTDAKGNEIRWTDIGDGKYTFTMPDSKVTVDVAFAAVEPQQPDEPDTPVVPSISFRDVAYSAYYYDAVQWAVSEGITNGTSATTFGPEESCTRGQIVTFLWRAAGSPTATGSNPFTDVKAGDYWYDAVLWAVSKGITNGTSATTFGPNETCTRGQTVTFLYRNAGSPAAGASSAFTDVASGAYYSSAVAWAVSNGITNGTTARTFGPDEICTRGQIVTFLYRAMGD